MNTSNTQDDNSTSQTMEQSYTTENKTQNDSVDFENGKLLDDEEIETQEFKGKTYLIELAGGAIMGALSIILAVLVNPYMPTIAPGLGIKIFDLIAIPMIFAYIIFGIRSGLLATITGCLGIIILPEAMAWLGMIAKFAATLPMIVIPWLYFKLNNYSSSKVRIIPLLEETTDNLRKYYPVLMGFAILFRLILMFVLNLFVFIPLFSGGFLTISSDPRTALLYATAYGLWNIVQGLGDAYIPYLLAYPTQLARMFSTW